MRNMKLFVKIKHNIYSFDNDKIKFFSNQHELNNSNEDITVQ